MKNEILYDAAGVPDIMVTFTPDELGLPATLKGRKVAEYLIGKYPATLIDGVPHSLPYQKPATGMSLDETIRICEAKGTGWHLLTNDEWAALARWSYDHDTMPTGNTNGGASHSHPEQRGATYDGSGKTLTGSGPIAWNHDRTAEGVADMCGNIWEHVGGVRFLDGQVQIIPGNEAAAGAGQSENSKEWTAIYTPDGDPVYYNVHDGEIELQPIAPNDKAWDGVPFSNLHEREDMDDEETLDKLRALALYPPEGYDGSDYFWVDTDGERCVARGGRWYHGADAGVFSLHGSDSRGGSNTNIGFRLAFVRYSDDSGTLDNLDEADNLDSAPQEIKDEIKANAKKLEAKENSYPLPKTLPEIVRYALAHGLAKLYEGAGGKDRAEFLRTAYESSDDELKKATAYSPQLSQIALAFKTCESIEKQIALASTLTVTISGKEADHE